MKRNEIFLKTFFFSFSFNISSEQKLMKENSFRATLKAFNIRNEKSFVMKRFATNYAKERCPSVRICSMKRAVRGHEMKHITREARNFMANYS